MGWLWWPNKRQRWCFILCPEALLLGLLAGPDKEFSSQLLQDDCIILLLHAALCLQTPPFQKDTDNVIWASGQTRAWELGYPYGAPGPRLCHKLWAGQHDFCPQVGSKQSHHEHTMWEESSLFREEPSIPVSNVFLHLLQELMCVSVPQSQYISEQSKISL